MAGRSINIVIKFLEQSLKDEGLNISKIVLFGSQSEGKATDESDIDIAIISKDFDNKDIFERSNMTKKAEISTLKKFMIPLDIITLTPDEFDNGSSLISEYARKGEEIYVQ